MRARSIAGIVLIGAVLCGLVAPWATANNIVITNVSVEPKSGYAEVQFDVSWDNSWRASWYDGANTVTNWDAAWVFVKYKQDGDSSWSHATLSTNDNEHTAAAGSTIDVGLTDDVGVGVFLYRSSTGSGSADYDQVRLRWNYADDGLTAAESVDVGVYGIEMVYVPTGSFYAGNDASTTSRAQFEAGTSGSAFLVTNENALTLGGGAAGSLGNNNNTARGDGGDDFDDSASQTLSAVFPKGYAAFYCAKYEVTQGQYAAFLNALDATQAGARFPNQYGNNRHTVTNGSVYSADAPDRACNYLDANDSFAYMDWAGLRPMTELEFEKACRGTIAPVANEYAWGEAGFPTKITGFVGSDGSGTETADPATANCNHNTGIVGPVRVGIFATPNSTRQESGATYWGIMEMSGNLAESPVITLGTSAGRSFTGTHGDGVLDAGGNKTNSDWTGVGIRGSYFSEYKWMLRISDRYYAKLNLGADYRNGCRVVRSAP